ncbi:MAG: SLATT domain-containing protein [Pseudomonadota bacterium]
MEQRIKEIIAECKRQHESCRYTTAALYSWQKSVRVYRVIFVIAPIVFGTVASAKILLKQPDFDWITAIAAMLAGLFPAIFKSLNLDESIKSMADSAHRFESLRDRFRQASLIGSAGPSEQLEKDFTQLMTRLDEARAACPAIPDCHFKIAQKKIDSGHYRFDIDSKDS